MLDFAVAELSNEPLRIQCHMVADVATFVSSGCNLDEKSYADDLGETPSPVSPSGFDGPDLPLQVQHKDQSCPLVNCPDSTVDARYPPSNSTIPIASPVVVPGFIADENLAAENDDVNSQSSEEWTAEVIANDPMHYALRCLLGENDSQSFFNSVTKDQRGVLFDFIDSCWFDGSCFSKSLAASEVGGYAACEDAE
ncbi:hypothetical protein Nepgr_020447 [Nepenthes gracilis]|uniref:Uncharacterized protein n=1 Tax=Nepenthes gracilis TaxID=150966 RepID=A0AAD3SYY8_NEPGR|nr:hypothetical protein Nepgr_020447 [Nepenthes gracilis]